MADANVAVLSTSSTDGILRILILSLIATPSQAVLHYNMQIDADFRSRTAAPPLFKLWRFADLGTAAEHRGRTRRQLLNAGDFAAGEKICVLNCDIQVLLGELFGGAQGNP